MKRKADGTIDRRTTDGRTSTLARGGFILERLDPTADSVSVAAKITPELLQHLDRLRGDTPRSAFIRKLIADAAAAKDTRSRP